MRNKIFEMLKKELREVFRDKKSLSMMLIIPIMIPLIILGMSAVFEGQLSKDTSAYNKIGFAYELSNSELELTKSMNIDYIIDTEDKLKELFNNDEIYLYVTKTDNKYTLNYNSNTESGSYASIFMDSYFNNYKNILQQDLLLNSGLNPENILDVITVDSNNIGTTNFYSSYIVSYAFLFIIMAITVSATYPATDTTAGEKERGTLETLLTFPIKSRDIIVGKLLSVTLSSIITGVLSLILALIAFNIANDTFTIYESARITLSAPSIIMSIFVIIVFSLFISGLCIAIASMCKSFKEAQSALTPLTFIALFPGMIAFMVGVKSSTLLSIVPFLNFSLVFNDISVGIINYLEIFLMFISTIIYIVIVIWFIVKSYKSEKILFND